MIERLLTQSSDACSVGSVYAHPLVQTALGGSLHPGGEELTLELARRAGLAPGMRVLDFGCGDGTGAMAIAREFGCSVLGLDPSPEQVQAAQARGATQGVGTLVRFQVLDPAQPDRWGSGFDAVLSECTLCLNQDPGVTLRSLAGCLRPGGTLLLSDMVVEEAAASFRSAAGFIACLGGALPYTDLLKLISEGGFNVEYGDNRPELVREVRNRIRSRVNVEEVLEALGPMAGNLRALVGEAETALELGQLGYAVIVARRV